MAIIKSDNTNLTINADGSSNDIKFQANGVEKASISSAGAFTSTTIDATKLTGALPVISGANLTGIEGVPSGCILMWSGASGAIPSGWVICDGTNSTPNLTGKFIKSATTAGGTGGSATTGAHTLSTAEMPSHTHPYEGGESSQASAHMGKGYYGHNYLTTQATGGGGSHTHTSEPEYFALIYIMKS